MKRKFISLILSAVIILGLASACNAGDDDPVVPYNDPVVPSIEITPAEYGQTEPSAPTPTPPGEIEEPAVSIVSVPAPSNERGERGFSSSLIKENPDGAEDYILISLLDSFSSVNIVSIKSYSNPDFFHYDDFVLGFGNGFFHVFDIYYGTTITDTPTEAVIFSDATGNYTRSFVLSRDEDGNFVAIEATINGLPRFPYIRDFRYLYDRPGTIPIKLFSYDEVNSTHYGDEENFRYMTVYIPEENFLEEAAKLMYLQELFSVDRLWYEGNRIYADLNVIELLRANNGSMGGFVRQSTLLRTLASFPDVEEIVVLINGAANLWADHFGYNAVFTVNGPLWADIDFILTEGVWAFG
jgi:hypothetical protein